MAVNITVRWGGPEDCSACSNFLIETATTYGSWTTLAASQAAASPYIAPSATLTDDHAYGSASIGLSTTASISACGYGMIEDANVMWSNKDAQGITGVTWLSGYGTYINGTAFYETNQYYEDTGISPSSAVMYRITHTNGASLVSGPNYFWYYEVPAPVSKDHCVVVFHLFSDLGYEPLASASILSYLTTNDQVGDNNPNVLYQRTSASRTIVTNNFGIAYGQYYKNSRRSALVSASDSSYTFAVTACGVTGNYVAATIPDRDWVFFKDIVNQ